MDESTSDSINIGQLVRQRDGRSDTALIGLGSHRGSVIAAGTWDAPMEEMNVPPAQEGSYEDVFHQAGANDHLLVSEELPDDAALADPRGNRAIGVVYHPARESRNYVPTNLLERYDAFVHLDETHALHPIKLHGEREMGPNLYPWGL